MVRLYELHLAAPAKINLGLEVLRRRDDGFHDINTIFAAIDLFDELILSPRDDGSIVCTVHGTEQLDGDENNLCVRAARAVREWIGNDRLGLTIELTKRIPIDAGLGGGSSDAAAVLRGAASVWRVDIDAQSMRSMALSLGSDVPFFLHGGVVHATSRGEEIAPIEITLPYWLLLVNAAIHVSTPWAYQAVGRTSDRAPSDIVGTVHLGSDDPAVLRERLVNDFEPAVFAEHPTLRAIKAALYESGAVYAAMSGSGSTVYGLFASFDQARHAATQFSGCWTYVARFHPSLSLLSPGSAEV